MEGKETEAKPSQASGLTSPTLLLLLLFVANRAIVIGMNFQSPSL